MDHHDEIQWEHVRLLAQPTVFSMEPEPHTFWNRPITVNVKIPPTVAVSDYKSPAIDITHRFRFSVGFFEPREKKLSIKVPLMVLPQTAAYADVLPPSYNAIIPASPNSPIFVQEDRSPSQSIQTSDSRMQPDNDPRKNRFSVSFDRNGAPLLSNSYGMQIPSPRRTPSPAYSQQSPSQSQYTQMQYTQSSPLHPSANQFLVPSPGGSTTSPYPSPQSSQQFYVAPLDPGDYQPQNVQAGPYGQNFVLQSLGPPQGVTSPWQAIASPTPAIEAAGPVPANGNPSVRMSWSGPANVIPSPWGPLTNQRSPTRN